MIIAPDRNGFNDADGGDVVSTGSGSDWCTDFHPVATAPGTDFTWHLTYRREFA